MLKLLLLLLCASVFGSEPYCDKRTVLKHMQVPTYDFSVRILDRISQETDSHFVFSPISTWLQLLTLADGANGHTLHEILKITNYNRTWTCLRIFVREIFNSLNDDSRVTMKHRSVVVIDNMLRVKKSFIRNVEKLNSVKVLTTNFKSTIESAAKVNEIINNDTNGTFTDTIDSDDFAKSVLIMVDAACMRANWRNPFNPIYTKPETFYSYEKVPVGTVNMMYQTGYFKVSYVADVDSKVLELPFNDRLTMLLLLPNNGTAADLFWSMRKIRLTTVVKLLRSTGTSLVNVKLPRFKITTDIDNIPELLYDMGVKKIFYPRIANFRKITNYNVYVSTIIDKVDVEVTETGVSGNVGPEMMVARGDSVDMFFNQPFAYLIVDKVSDVIIFAGIYSNPSLY